MNDAVTETNPCHDAAQECCNDWLYLHVFKTRKLLPMPMRIMPPEASGHVLAASGRAGDRFVADRGSSKQTANMIELSKKRASV